MFSLDTIQIGTDAATTTITNHFTMLTTLATNPYTGSTLFTANKNVGDNCNFFKINNEIFVKPATGSTYVRAPATDIGGALAAGVSYDKTFKYAFKTDTIYKLGATDYTAIITGITEIKTTTKIGASTIEDRVWLQSFQAGTGALSSVYNNVQKIYAFDGTNWAALNLPTEMASYTTGSGSVTTVSSLDHEFFIDWYNNGTSAVPQKICNLNHINLTDGSASIFSTPP